MSVDYLQTQGRIAKILSAIACAAATAICCLFVAVAAATFFRPNMPAMDRKSAWFVVIFFGLMGVATTTLGYRLARGRVAQNKITTMPVWFIQAFGIFFLIGMALSVYSTGEWLFALEGTSIAIAMIFIGREISRRSSRKPDK